MPGTGIEPDVQQSTGHRLPSLLVRRRQRRAVLHREHADTAADASTGLLQYAGLWRAGQRLRDAAAGLDAVPNAVQSRLPRFLMWRRSDADTGAMSHGRSHDIVTFQLGEQTWSPSVPRPG